MCNTNPNNFKTETEYLMAVHGIQPVIANPMQTFQCGKCGTQNIISVPPPIVQNPISCRVNCVPQQQYNSHRTMSQAELYFEDLRKSHTNGYNQGFRDGYRTCSSHYKQDNEMSGATMLGIAVLLLVCGFFVMCGVVACIIH